MENAEKKRGGILGYVGLAFFFGLIIGAASVAIAWNGKCTGINKASRGPVYEIPLGANASQFATAYGNKVWMMLEAPTRPDRAGDPAVRK